jgi:hypothetical protein
MNRLKKGLINSRISLTALRLNCQNIFFFKCEYNFFLVILIEMFILKTTMYHKSTLTNQKLNKKTLNIGGMSAQSHMLLFVICFPS